MGTAPDDDSSVASFDSPLDDHDDEPLDDFEFSSAGEDEDEDVGVGDDDGGTETPKNKKRKVSMSPMDSLAVPVSIQQSSSLSSSTPSSPAANGTSPAPVPAPAPAPAPARRSSPRKQQKSNNGALVGMVDGTAAPVEAITPEKPVAEPAKATPAPAGNDNKAAAPDASQQQPPSAPTSNGSNAVTPPGTATKQQRKDSPVKPPPPTDIKKETTKKEEMPDGGSQEKPAPQTAEKVKSGGDTKDDVTAEPKAPTKKRKSASSDGDVKEEAKKGGATNGTSKDTSKAAATVTAAKPAPKKKTKKQTFQDEVLQVLFYSCKPYTPKLLAQQLKQPESSINFCMLSLVDKGWVVKKEFANKRGTSKELFWANQDARNKELADALKAVPPHELLQAQQELKALLQNEQNLAAELAKTLQEPSNEDLDVKIKSAEEEITDLEKTMAEMKGRIEAAQAEAGALSGKKNGKKRSFPMTPLRMKKKINNLRSEWKKRKEKCMDFVEQLADGMEKKVKDVMRTVLDVETDEAAGAQMPPKYAV